MSSFVAHLDFPCWSLAFLDDDPKRLAVVGGGGAGRSGVKNSVSFYDIDVTAQSCKRAVELELSKKEDAPMTVAAHPEGKQLLLGINSTAEQVKTGTNENLRLFSYTKDSIKHESSTSTMSSKDPDEFQKITRFSRDGSLVAVGSSKNQLSLLAFPSLSRVFPDVAFEEEMFDADFNDASNLLLGASSQRICIFSLPSSDNLKSSASSESSSSSTLPPEPLQVIERPVLKQSLKCTFRAARFGRHSTSSKLYTLVNATPQFLSGKKGSAKGAEKKAFISVWDTDSWSLIRTRTVSKKPVTSFDVSPNGKMLAIAGADLSITIFDANTIRPLLSVLAAHDFPSTCLSFSPDSALLVSGSADNTLRIISADAALHPARHQGLQLALVTLLILLIAVLVQMYAGDKVVGLARKHLHV